MEKWNNNSRVGSFVSNVRKDITWASKKCDYGIITPNDKM